MTTTSLREQLGVRKNLSLVCFKRRLSIRTTNRKNLWWYFMRIQLMEVCDKLAVLECVGRNDYAKTL